MTNFQLFKKRDFSAIITDTIQFFKQYGKNYLINFIKINGVLLLAICIVYYFYIKNFMSQAFIQTQANPADFFGKNIGLFFAIMGIGMLVGIIYYVFSTAIPMIYLRLISKKTEDEFQSGEVFNQVKSKAGKIVLFGIISFFILIPLTVIFFFIAIALSFLLVGIPLLIIGIPALYTWFMQSQFVYVNEEIGYFEALGRGWKNVFSNFLHVVGSTIITLLCVMVLGSSLSMIPGFMMIGSVISSGGHPEPTVMTPFMITIYIVSFILSSLLNNVFYVQQGLIYYSNIEASEQNNAFSEIDNIGNNEE